ncbi:MAG: hypothetical protein Q9181_003393, partial [Wetmoreana brouardii]
LLAELERIELLVEQTVALLDDIDHKTIKARGQILVQEVDKASKQIDEINRLLPTPRVLFTKFNNVKQTKAIWV